MEMNFNKDTLTADLDTLKEIIDVNYDASEFYQSARDKTDIPALQREFDGLCALHEKTIRSLQVYMREISDPTVSIQPDQTLTGQVEKLFSEIACVLSSNTNETLINQLEAAEDRCIRTIEAATEKETLSPSTKHVLSQEHIHLQRSHDHMKLLKDALKAA